MIQLVSTSEPSSVCLAKYNSNRIKTSESNLEFNSPHETVEPTDVSNNGVMNNSTQILNGFTEAILKAMKPKWSIDEYNRILFCSISDTAQFTLCDEPYESNMVFSTVSLNAGQKDNSYEIPIIYISFCGTILQSSIIEDEHWIEVEDNGHKILCTTALMLTQDWDIVKKTYHQVHQIYRKQEPHNDQVNLLWQIERRSTKISETGLVFSLSKPSEFEGRRVMIVGKLWEKHHNRFVFIKECHFVDEYEEKHFLRLMKSGL